MIHEHEKLNDLSLNVHDTALSDEPGEFVLNPQEYAVGEDGQLLSESEGYHVDVVSGDEYIEKEGLDTPDVVKMDIEGAELGALRGFENTLEDTRTVFVEVHPEMMDEAGEAVRDELVRQGFKITSSEKDQETTFRLVAER